MYPFRVDASSYCQPTRRAFSFHAISFLLSCLSSRGVTCGGGAQFFMGSQQHTHPGFTLCTSADLHTHGRTLLRQYHLWGGLPDLRHPQTVSGRVVSPLCCDFAQGCIRLHHGASTWHLLVSPPQPQAPGQGLHPVTLAAQALTPSGEDRRDFSVLLHHLDAANQLDQCWFDFGFGVSYDAAMAQASSSSASSSSSGPAGHVPALYMRLDQVQPHASVSGYPMPRLNYASSDPDPDPAQLRLIRRRPF